jgi:ParB family chromosome partitioning protein
MSNTRRNALGRGLSALLENASTDITTSEPKPVNSISEILISQIEANPFQPRTDFKDEELNELAESIKVHGLIQPITVRKIGFDRYQLISGERRTRASRIAGLEKIPAFLRLADDQGMLEMALIENIQRENLNAMEVALSYKRLLDECKLNQEELGSRVGKNRSTVNNYMRLLKLPDNIQAALRDDKISMGHARAIINIDNVDEQQYLFNEMMEKDLSVRQVEALVREASERVKNEKNEVATTGKTKSKSSAKPDEVISKFQKILSEKFNSKIKISIDQAGKGNISIPYQTEEDLKRILDLLA